MSDMIAEGSGMAAPALDGRAPTALSAVRETDTTADVDVGRALRRLRDASGLSIRALAERSGLAVNTLSLIENGKSSPSVSTLQMLAQGLQVPIAAFFETEEPKREVVHLTAGQRLRATFAGGTLEDLGAGLAVRTISAFVVTLEPGTDSGLHPIVHTGDEVVFCLAGRIEYFVGEHTYVLEAGDSLAFAAHLPHRWQNPDTTSSRALLVLCPSDVHDRPTARHFAPPTPQWQSAEPR
jgi:transcriptional regulator with XRE-family HTH domain